jgi:hypothetical protein
MKEEEKICMHTHLLAPKAVMEAPLSVVKEAVFLGASDDDVGLMTGSGLLSSSSSLSSSDAVIMRRPLRSASAARSGRASFTPLK